MNDAHGGSPPWAFLWSQTPDEGRRRGAMTLHSRHAHSVVPSVSRHVPYCRLGRLNEAVDQSEACNLTWMPQKRQGFGGQPWCSDCLIARDLTDLRDKVNSTNVGPNLGRMRTARTPSKEAIDGAAHNE